MEDPDKTKSDSDLSQKNKELLVRLEKELKEAHKEVDRVKAEIEKCKRKERQSLFAIERDDLNRSFHITVVILAAVSILGYAAIGLVIPKEVDIHWICGIAGMMGSAISALISCLQRRANGFEFNDGTKYPTDKPEAKFSLRMSIFFRLRPLLGLFTGIVVCYGFEHLFQVESEQANGVLNFASEKLTINKITFWSLLAGLFAKTLVERLRGLFKSLIGVS